MPLRRLSLQCLKAAFEALKVAAENRKWTLSVSAKSKSARRSRTSSSKVREVDVRVLVEAIRSLIC
jgi:hypothetical protein